MRLSATTLLGSTINDTVVTRTGPLVIVTQHGIIGGPNNGAPTQQAHTAMVDRTS